MIPITLLSAFLVPFISALLLVPFVGRVALRKGWVDKPDGERKQHARPTPNVGGVAIAASVGAGLISLIVVGDLLPFEVTPSTVIVVVGALIVLGTGFYDDVRDLGFKKKFFIQVVIAYLLMQAGYHVEVANLPFMVADPFQQGLYAIPLTMIWIVGILNAVNLLDGLDGLATGVSIIAFACLAAIFGMQGDVGFAAIALLMIGALAAFLVYNFNPASIFMGDSGSLFLGYMLAICTLSLEDGVHANPMLALLVPVIVLGLPLLDTCLSIVRRLLARRSPFAPDRDHIHHRLSRLWSGRHAVLFLYGVALWFGVAAILMTLIDPPFGFAVAGITLVAAYIGVRSLGYLKLPRTNHSIQLSFDFPLGDTHLVEGNRNGVNGTGSEGQGPHEYSASEVKGDLVTERRESLEIES